MSNEQNLIQIQNRTPEERFAITSKGGKTAQANRQRRKKEEAEQKSLIAILRGFLFTDVKPTKLKKMLRSTGSDDTNYFAALVAATMLSSIKKGEMSALIKLIEVMGESQANGGDTNETSKSFNNLVEAIKNVREIK